MWRAHVSSTHVSVSTVLDALNDKQHVSRRRRRRRCICAVCSKNKHETATIAGILFGPTATESERELITNRCQVPLLRQSPTAADCPTGSRLKARVTAGHGHVCSWPLAGIHHFVTTVWDRECGEQDCEDTMVCTYERKPAIQVYSWSIVGRKTWYDYS